MNMGTKCLVGRKTVSVIVRYQKKKKKDSAVLEIYPDDVTMCSSGQ